jgi:cytochrome P450
MPFHSPLKHKDSIRFVHWQPIVKHCEWIIFCRLQYVEAVLTEVMRINTVAPVAPAHRVTQDTTLNGYNIPKVNWDTLLYSDIGLCSYIKN